MRRNRKAEAGRGNQRDSEARPRLLGIAFLYAQTTSLLPPTIFLPAVSPKAPQRYTFEGSVRSVMTCISVRSLKTSHSRNNTAECTATGEVIMRRTTGQDTGFQAPNSRARRLRGSFLQIVAACLFIGFISFALAFGILGGHKTSTTTEADGATSASPGAAGEPGTADGTTSASPGAAQPGSPDLLASASPAAGTSAGSPDLVTSPSTAAGGGGGTGAAPDLVTSPSTAAPAPSPTTPPDLVTSPSTPAPAPTPTTPPDTVTQPSPGATPTPAPGTNPTPGNDEDHPDVDEDGIIPPALAFELPLLAGGAGVALLARRRGKSKTGD